MKLTEFETAILNRIGEDEPSIRVALENMVVIKRDYTPCGSYTDFEKFDPDKPFTRHVGIDLIEVPGVENGMIAILWLRDQHPQVLELVTFGGEDWNGEFIGFEFVDSV